MAFLHPEKVPILPHWHQEFLEWGEQKKLWEAKKKQATGSIGSVEDLGVPKLTQKVHPGGEGHLLKDMQNLDPKAIFANERTLLHYAEKGVYAGALGVVMLHQDGILKL